MEVDAFGGSSSQPTDDAVDSNVDMVDEEDFTLPSLGERLLRSCHPKLYQRDLYLAQWPLTNLHSRILDGNGNVRCRDYHVLPKPAAKWIDLNKQSSEMRNVLSGINNKAFSDDAECDVLQLLVKAFKRETEAMEAQNVNADTKVVVIHGLSVGNSPADKYKVRRIKRDLLNNNSVEGWERDKPFEIDLLLFHSTLGCFIFEVKSAGDKNSTFQLKRQFKIVKSLSNSRFPVYSVTARLKFRCKESSQCVYVGTLDVKETALLWLTCVTHAKKRTNSLQPSHQMRVTSESSNECSDQLTDLLNQIVQKYSPPVAQNFVGLADNPFAFNFREDMLPVVGSFIALQYCNFTEDGKPVTRSIRLRPNWEDEGLPLSSAAALRSVSKILDCGYLSGSEFFGSELNPGSDVFLTTEQHACVDKKRLLLRGFNGTGKTLLIREVAIYLASKAQKVAVVTMPSNATWLRDYFNRRGANKVEVYAINRESIAWTSDLERLISNQYNVFVDEAQDILAHQLKNKYGSGCTSSGLDLDKCIKLLEGNQNSNSYMWLAIGPLSYFIYKDQCSYPGFRSQLCRLKKLPKFEHKELTIALRYTADVYAALLNFLGQDLENDLWLEDFEPPGVHATRVWCMPVDFVAIEFDGDLDSYTEKVCRNLYSKLSNFTENKNVGVNHWIFAMDSRANDYKRTLKAMDMPVCSICGAEFDGSISATNPECKKIHVLSCNVKVKGSCPVLPIDIRSLEFQSIFLILPPTLFFSTDEKTKKEVNRSCLCLATRAMSHLCVYRPKR